MPVDFYVAVSARSIATGDFNKDGAQDVAAVCSQQLCGLGVEVLMGHGDGTFASPVLYAAGDRPDDAIAVADFNQDGNLDIVAPDFLDSNVTVLLGNGDGTFRPPVLSAGLGIPASMTVNRLLGPLGGSHNAVQIAIRYLADHAHGFAQEFPKLMLRQGIIRKSDTATLAVSVIAAVHVDPPRGIGKCHMGATTRH